MTRRTWSPLPRQRTLSIFMVILVSTGYRRWLSRPWQWSIRDYLALVAICAATLALSRSPIPVIIFFMTFAGAVYTCLNLARHGFKLADIAILLAIVLLTAAFLLPAIERTRGRTIGTRFFPSLVPTRIIALFHGSE
jgi:hypothetical protein